MVGGEVVIFEGVAAVGVVKLSTTQLALMSTPVSSESLSVNALRANARKLKSVEFSVTLTAPASNSLTVKPSVGAALNTQPSSVLRVHLMRKR